MVKKVTLHRMYFHYLNVVLRFANSILITGSTYLSFWLIFSVSVFNWRGLFPFNFHSICLWSHWFHANPGDNLRWSVFSLLFCCLVYMFFQFFWCLLSAFCALRLHLLWHVAHGWCIWWLIYWTLLQGLNVQNIIRLTKNLGVLENACRSQKAVQSRSSDERWLIYKCQ